MKLHYFKNFIICSSNKNLWRPSLFLNQLSVTSSTIVLLTSIFLYPLILNFFFFGVQEKTFVWTFFKKFSLPSLLRSYCSKFLNFITSSYKKMYFAKYFYIGLGYKLFMFSGSLFVWVGLTHYSLLPVSDTIKIFPKKRRIYLVGTSPIQFNNFLATIRRVRKMDIYKGKGLLEVKSYKGFIKMKSGKKKQY